MTRVIVHWIIHIGLDWIGSMPFTVGEQFASFELLNERVTEIEHRENLCLWKRDCRTVEKAKTKGVKRHMNADFVYYSVHYACYHGGRKFKSKSAGVRTKLRSVTVYYAVIIYVHMLDGTLTSRL